MAGAILPISRTHHFRVLGSAERPAASRNLLLLALEKAQQKCRRQARNQQIVPHTDPYRDHNGAKCGDSYYTISGNGLTIGAAHRPSSGNDRQRLNLRRFRFSVHYVSTTAYDWQTTSWTAAWGGKVEPFCDFTAIASSQMFP